METVFVFALAAFCIIAGFLLSLFQQSMKNQDAILASMQRIEAAQVATKAACEASRDALLKPIDMPADDFKKAGIYAIGADGDFEAQVIAEANKRLKVGAGSGEKHPIL